MHTSQILVILFTIEIVIGPVTAQSNTSTSCTRRRWCKYNLTCLSESLSVSQWKSTSAHGCVLKASAVSDDVVAQWNLQSGNCSIFVYQDVCRIMKTANPTANATCSLYRKSSMVGCDVLPNPLNPAFIGVWLADGANRVYNNMVCDADKYSKMHTFNLTWTDEGGVFDGFSSYALINDSRLLVTDGSGYTWLIRLKREPRPQPFLEFANCLSFNVFHGPHLWEFSSPNQLYYYSNRVPPIFNANSQQNFLPTDRNAWTNVGMIVGSSSANSAYYCNGIRQQTVQVQVPSIDSQYPCYILQVGRRFNTHFLKGTVKVVALARGALSDADINQFFDLLP